MALGLPHDSMVWLDNKGPRGVFDNALTAADARQRPSWHKMNHAWTRDLDTCNVEMRYDVEGLGWWARRKIAPLEQLRYDYGKAPSGWTRIQSCELHACTPTFKDLAICLVGS
mgnify:CR=1 FL=1